MTPFQAEFDNPVPAERGLLFSQPGGLYETFKRYQIPLKLHQVRRTEGVEIYEEFFEELEKELATGKSEVVLIDILNWLHGCNRGTGVDYHEFTTNQILQRQHTRLEEHQQQYYAAPDALEKSENFVKRLEHIDFSREYTDRSASFQELLDPTPEQIEILNDEMGKHVKKDLKDCGACGYHSCLKMAKAVLNGLYRPEQCHHFLENFFSKNQEQTD